MRLEKFAASNLSARLVDPPSSPPNLSVRRPIVPDGPTPCRADQKTEDTFRPTADTRMSDQTIKKGQFIFSIKLVFV